MTDIMKRSQSQHPALHGRYQAESPRYEPPEDPLLARRLIERLLKRKFQILAIVLAVLIPAAIYCYLATPLYRSSVLIQIDPDPVQVLPYRDVTDASTAAPYYEVYMKTQEQMLKGPALSARIAGRLESESKSQAMLAEIPRIRTRFEIRRIENSQLFEISYLAPVPEVAADMVNIFAEEHIKELFRARQETREKARKLLEGELRELEQRLQTSEKDLVQYARDHNMIAAEPGQGDLVEEKLSILARQLTDSEAALIVARSKADSMKRASLANFPEKLLTPHLLSLSTKVLQLEHELTALRTTYGENWPSVVQKRNEMTLARDQLTREKAAALAQANEQVQADLQIAEAQRRMIANSVNAQQQLVDRYRSASIQHSILRREVETNQKLYDGLLERLKQTSVTAGLEFGNIHVVEPGRPDTRADSPRVPWILGLASLLGLALGVCFALFKDFWDDSISTMEEAEQIATIPALGSVPTIKGISSRLQIGSGAGGNNGSKATLRLRPAGPAPAGSEMRLPPEASESIRTLCASILLSKSDKPPRTILFTSAAPFEGKTTLVNCLGKAFAESGNRTLLIESDMRKPALARALGIGTEGGLSLYLSGHISPLPTVHETHSPNLFAVAAGPQAPNPPALLNSEKLDRLLDEMALSYQFVLLDGPPLLAVADSRVLCSRVDGVVLVVRAGHTPKHLVRRAWTLLENSGANILGMVLNQAQRSRFESSYSRYYSQ